RAEWRRLGRSGFAGDDHIASLRLSAAAGLGIHDPDHSLSGRHEPLTRKLEVHPIRDVVPFRVSFWGTIRRALDISVHESRPDPDAVARDRGCYIGHLNRRDTN